MKERIKMFYKKNEDAVQAAGYFAISITCAIAAAKICQRIIALEDVTEVRAKSLDDGAVSVAVFKRNGAVSFWQGIPAEA